MSTNEGIAIIGMDCRYSGANNLEQYWENILSLRQQFRRIPEKRLNLDHYYSADKSKVDHTYSQKASVLSGYYFDRVKYKVAKSTFEQTDMTHWLALDVAAGALKDAGFENGTGLDKKRIGVVLGNSLTGEFTRAHLMRGRWPYVFKILESTLSGLNYSKEEIIKVIDKAEKLYKEPFPVPDADSLAGGLSNTIAGRICNYFDFNGGGFTIDGACSSSLLAFANGCNSLINGDVDVVIVGGIDLSIDPFEVIGFARNGALAANEMQVYSAKAEGFWPGEGCGVAVLMRASEAVDRKCNIYAVIKGWGISSDGNGGITRPKSETQQLAFDRAYERAGYGMDTISMFEGHGTGTPLGDQVELTALVNSLRSAGKKGDPAILGSVKHLIGHTKAAAGVAGAIKATLAIKHGIIPASIPNNNPNRVLIENPDIITLGKTPITWTGDTPMRASIMSMGFGGINVHLTMEAAAQAKRSKRVPGKVSKLAGSLRNCEIFPICAHSKKSFEKKLQRLQALARDISRAEFTDLSATLCASFQNSGLWRAGIVADTPDALLDNLVGLQQVIQRGDTRFVNVGKGIFFEASGRPGKLAFLFPGQGSPVYTGLGAFHELANEFSAYSLYKAEHTGEVADTSIAQPVIVQNTLQSVALLEQLGVEAQWGIGHSLGEIAALSWAGVMNYHEAVELAKERGKSMSEFGEAGGAMVALKCAEDDLHCLIDRKQVCITGYNGHGNYVVGGAVQEVMNVQQEALEKGIQAVQLKVSHAFHTPMMKKAAEAFQGFLNTCNFEPVQKNIISTVTGSRLAADKNICDLLYKQIEAPVQLTQAVEQIKQDADFFIEVGPGQALSSSLKGYKEFYTLSLDYGSDGLRGFFNILSAAYISGNDIQFEELSNNRFYRAFDVDNWTLDVLVNPCEKNDFKSEALQSINDAAPQADASQIVSTAPVHVVSSFEGIQNFLKKIISDRVDIPVELINNEDRIMSQLHINSLTITEIISTAIKTFNKSQKVFSEASVLANSDGSIHDLSVLIAEGDAGNETTLDKGKVSFDRIHNWTHLFSRKDVEKKATKLIVDNGPGKIIVRGSMPASTQWEEKLAKEDLSLGDGAIYVYRSEMGKEVLYDFVDFLNQPYVRRGQFVTLVNIRSAEVSGDLRPLLRTFQQEVPQVIAMSLELDGSLDQPEHILLAELKTATKYKEVIYDAKGQRSESEWEAFFPAPCDIKESIQHGDVLLATGGGKGITFESVFDLAVNTGARLAILGRSIPGQDEELAKNINRLAREGIEFRYYTADVCDREQVRQVISRVATELGPIRVLIHGAGMNHPKSLNQLTPSDFQKTLAVKLEGLRNVIESLELDKLNLLIGYGSVIAEAGMQGNADYAWANDQMALYIDRLSAQLGHCRCLTLEWSVWDETGMGVSLNSIEKLKKMGVWPIAIQRGLEILKAVIADKECKGRFIASGRMGAIPTLHYTKKQLPLGRYISKIKHYVPGIEVVSEVNISLSDDIYLQNHVFQNQFVFPTVMILEGMAQVCNILHPGSVSWMFEDLKIHKSIVIPKQGANLLRFIITRVSREQFRAVVQSEDSNFEVNCFETLVTFEGAPVFSGDVHDFIHLQTLDFNVEKSFYDDLLFHHGPFRRINAFFRIHALESLAQANSSSLDKWFGAYVPDTHLLGDPGLNDAAIHCHQACRPAHSLLPTAAGKIVFNSKEVQGPFFIKTVETREEINHTVIDVYVVNSSGEIKQYWKDLVLTNVAGTAFSGQWDPHLLVPYIENQLIKLSKNRTIKLPLNSFLELVRSLASGNKVQEYLIEGYAVSLDIKDPSGTTQIQNDHSLKSVSGKQPHLSLELNIAGLEEKVSLKIWELGHASSGSGYISNIA